MSMNDPTGSKYIHVILSKLNDLPKKEQKITYLQSLKGDKQVMDVIRLTYDTRIKFRKMDIPPFRTMPTSHFTLTYSSLRREVRRFHIFADRPANTLPYHKMINNLVQILESIPHEEANIVISMLETRRLPYAGATASLMKEAFPEMLNDNG